MKHRHLSGVLAKCCNTHDTPYTAMPNPEQRHPHYTSHWTTACFRPGQDPAMASSLPIRHLLQAADQRLAIDHRAQRPAGGIHHRQGSPKLQGKSNQNRTISVAPTSRAAGQPVADRKIQLDRTGSSGRWCHVGRLAPHAVRRSRCAQQRRPVPAPRCPRERPGGSAHSGRCSGTATVPGRPFRARRNSPRSPATVAQRPGRCSVRRGGTAGTARLPLPRCASFRPAQPTCKRKQPEAALPSASERQASGLVAAGEVLPSGVCYP